MPARSHTTYNPYASETSFEAIPLLDQEFDGLDDSYFKNSYSRPLIDQF